jgi:ABC-type nitrate/sulfonate/bicarbonate transport system substrate-binding protein
MKTFLSTVVALFLVLLVNPSSLKAATPFPKVVTAFASFSEKEGAIFVAEDQGFFRKYGLDVKHVYVSSGSVALAALASGDAQFYTGSPTGATLGAVVGGLDVVFVAGLVNKLNGAFAVEPSIKTPADLKNKTIGVQSIGGGIWMITMMLLNHWDLDLKRDNIKFRVLGDFTVLTQSLASHLIDGSYLTYTFASKMERQGFRILADLEKLPIPYQNTGVIARRGFVSSSPDIVERFLRGLSDGVAFAMDPANKTSVMKSLAKGLRLSRTEDALEGYEGMLTLYQRQIYPTTEGIRNAIRVIGTTNEKIRSLKAENLVDDRFVKKLEQEGRF